jgi:hypothetical protein
MIFSPKQPADISDALASLRAQDSSTLAMTDEGLIDISVEPPFIGVPIEQQMQDAANDAAATPPQPVYNAVTSSTWRVLEEERASAMDRVHECDAEIAKWTERRDDAQRAADGCAAGQRAMER